MEKHPPLLLKHTPLHRPVHREPTQSKLPARQAEGHIPGQRKRIILHEILILMFTPTQGYFDTKEPWADKNGLAIELT
jgi:hypothetical protein